MDVKSRGLYFKHTFWVLQNVVTPRIFHEEASHTAQVTQIDGLPLFPLCRDSGHRSKADYGSRRRQVAFHAGNILSFNPTLGNGHCCYWRKQKLKRGEMDQQVENVDLSQVCLTPEPAFCPSASPRCLRKCWKDDEQFSLRLPSLWFWPSEGSVWGPNCPLKLGPASQACDLCPWLEGLCCWV